MRKVITIPGLILLFFILGCKDPYFPPVTSTDKKLLVVEGVLNLGGPTSIRLSRTAKVDRNPNIELEKNALVKVEGMNNSIEFLNADSTGLYKSPDLHLLAGNQYRLRINTSDGKEYLSAYIIVKQTPDIDSITWKRNTEGVQINLNAHDNTNNTRYYRWEFDEAWEYYANYSSPYVYKNPDVVTRAVPDELVYDCFNFHNSTTILLGNTTKLAADVVSEEPMVFIPQNTERLTVRYSILIRQYALDKESNAFYELLRKNSESIGTIFDAQPSEVRGNLTCVSDPTETVIGYITACSIKEKRIFISNDQVQPWFLRRFCEEIFVTKDSFDFYFNGGAWIPYEYDRITGGYFSSSTACVDCRARGGTTKKPSFW